jgi:hypothetical protein
MTREEAIYEMEVPHQTSRGFLVFDYRASVKDVYEVRHRSGKILLVATDSTYGARRKAGLMYSWKQKDMHVRLIEIDGKSPFKRKHDLTLWILGEKRG